MALHGNFLFHRQALLAAQRHQPDEPSKRSSEIHHTRDPDDDKLLDVVGTSDSPLHLPHHLHHSGGSRIHDSIVNEIVTRQTIF